MDHRLGYPRGLPSCYMKAGLQAVLHAEKKLGRPVYVCEVITAFRETSYLPLPIHITVFSICMDLYSNDELLANYNLDQVSLNPALQHHPQTNPDSDFKLMSDRKESQFKTYKLLPSMQLKPTEETPVINFDQLRDLLLSKDFSRQAEYQKLISGDLKFLDRQSDMTG